MLVSPISPSKVVERWFPSTVNVVAFELASGLMIRPSPANEPTVRLCENRLKMSQLKSGLALCAPVMVSAVVSGERSSRWRRFAK